MLGWGPETGRGRTAFNTCLTPVASCLPNNTHSALLGHHTNKTILFGTLRHVSQSEPDRLCGLVVRVLGYRSGGPGPIPGTTRFSENKKEKKEKK
jgi:hypothetical protein